MTDDMKALCAAIGHALLAFSNEDAPAPPQEPEPQKRKRRSGYTLPEHPVTCAVCGKQFLGRGNRVKYCPACARQIQIDKVCQLVARKTATQVQQPPVGDVVRCERMHATIPATMCGTRGECKGRPLCPNLPEEI